MQRKTTLSNRSAASRSLKGSRKKSIAGKKTTIRTKSHPDVKEYSGYLAPLFKAREHDPL